jgi:DnaK suppressor protein
MNSTAMPADYGAPAPSPAQLAMFRSQLEEQRQFRIDQLDELRTIDPHNASEVTEVLAAGARAALLDVLNALHRMDTGAYGRCTHCGTRLPLERLEVLPQVGECMPCRRFMASQAAR